LGDQGGMPIFHELRRFFRWDHRKNMGLNEGAMPKDLIRPNLKLLRNKIDYTKVPFSDRGSRLLVFLNPFQSKYYVKLAERLTGIDPGIETYLRRPPFIHNLSLVDETGEMLDFEVISYPHIIYMSTRLGDFGLLFRDIHTLAFGVPPGITAGIKFHVTPQIWKNYENGGEFRAIRDLTYLTNSRVVVNQVTPERAGYSVELIVEANEDCTISIMIGTDTTPVREVRPFSELDEAAEKRWQDWFQNVPPVEERFLRAYAYAWWVMGNNLIKPYGTVAFEAMMPSKVNYVGLWLWDSAMHALAYRHIDPDLARNQIRAMLACQLADGMLPDAIYDEGVISEIDHPFVAKVTKPPILAWSALKLHETSPDLAFLREIYIPLVRWNAWWFSMNDDDVDGLAQYNHPYSSGLDDNPLWDYGMPVESPDLNTYLCVQMGSLAVMAELIGITAEAAMWRRRAEALVNRMINHFWDPAAGVFRATHNHKPIPVITPFNLYPLWTGQLPADIRDRLLAHLKNPDEFWGPLPIPSVARNDPHFDPNTMWRGPVWANINYFFYEALKQLGEKELANELREKTLAMIMNLPTMVEYYHADTGEPGSRAADAFGWTAAVFIDLAISASQESDEELLPVRKL
jgi:putative isomerase